MDKQQMNKLEKKVLTLCDKNENGDFYENLN